MDQVTVDGVEFRPVDTRLEERVRVLESSLRTERGISKLMQDNILTKIADIQQLTARLEEKPSSRGYLADQKTAFIAGWCVGQSDCIVGRPSTGVEAEAAWDDYLAHQETQK